MEITQGIDYILSDTLIHFPAGISSTVLNIQVLNDSLDEDLETIHFILENEELQSEWSLGYRSDVIMSIVDDVDTSVRDYQFYKVVYPNPTSGEFFLSSGISENIHASLYNSSGQLVPIDRDRRRVQVKGQPDGHYYLLLDDGKSIETVKLLLVSY